ncbi:MAG: hypothetical protein MJ193_03655 [Clostridia bacterium]|nr:hypothetical protein [Clostridia bacterium]
MFGGLVDGDIERALKGENVIEMRFRIGRPLVYSTPFQKKVLKINGKERIVSSNDIQNVLAVASNFSFYAINDDLISGFLVKNGIRIGVAGEAVVENGKMLTMKNINYLVMRIPHEIKGSADRIYNTLSKGAKSVIIISPPCGGKTTLLRDLIRQASRLYNIYVIDERFEIAACDKGVPTLDVGDAEIASGISKKIAYQNSIRAMSPEIIATDEVFSSNEIDAVADIMRSGVKVFATVHGNGIQTLENDKEYSRLIKLFDVIVTLKPVGEIVEIISND